MILTNTSSCIQFNIILKPHQGNSQSRLPPLLAQCIGTCENSKTGDILSVVKPCHEIWNLRVWKHKKKSSPGCGDVFTRNTLCVQIYTYIYTYIYITLQFNEIPFANPHSSTSDFSLFQGMQSGLQEVGECKRTRAIANGKLQSAIKASLHAQIEGYTRPNAQMRSKKIKGGGGGGGGPNWISICNQSRLACANRRIHKGKGPNAKPTNGVRRGGGGKNQAPWKGGLQLPCICLRACRAEVSKATAAPVEADKICEITVLGDFARSPHANSSGKAWRTANSSW